MALNNGSMLEIAGLTKNYCAENGTIVHALQGIDLDIAVNDFVCIVGPSGCGKSTLLRIMAGLEKETAGVARYLGKAIDRPTPQIGMVFQEYSLLPWRTVIDNVGLGPEFANMPKRQRQLLATEYLQLVGLEKFAQAYPHELSGGMRQRVAIARALANDPDVLLMDEPFGALDAHTRILLQKELLRIWERHRKTIVFVTHSVDEAIFLADRICVMSGTSGRIMEMIDVTMPRPRERSNPLYGQLAERILRMLEGEVVKMGIL